MKETKYSYNAFQMTSQNLSKNDHESLEWKRIVNEDAHLLLM